MRSTNSRRLVVALCLAAVQVGLGCNPAPDDAGRPTSSSPIAVSDDGSSVWVVNPDSNTVGRIDTATASLIEEAVSILPTVFESGLTTQTLEEGSTPPPRA